MSAHQTEELPLFSRGMMALLAAQFFAALADNAVLIVAIAMIKASGQYHLVPLLQGAFVVPFILLAPFTGQFADGYPKGRVMLVANLLKFAGSLLMALGASPLTGYTLVGVGAATYSPAKYGILSQMFGPERLVRANGLLEGTTIIAILLGVLLGGWLADRSLPAALSVVIVCYLLAAGGNLLIPRLPPETPLGKIRLGRLVRRFLHLATTLASIPDARFAMLASSLFLGSGVTLRLLLFAWVPVALVITDNQTPANLLGVVSVGIVLGAAAAGAWISLRTVNRALAGGLLLGPIILALAPVRDLTTAGLLLGALGVCGGLFLVPLNALLQERGHESIGAGNALAVQNFLENVVMLLFVGAYSGAGSAGIPVTTIITAFGLLLFVAIGALAATRLQRKAVA